MFHFATDTKNQEPTILLLHPEFPTFPGSAENSVKIIKSFHGLIDKFDNLPDYGNLLNVILNISLIAVQDLSDCKTQNCWQLCYMFLKREHF